MRVTRDAQPLLVSKEQGTRRTGEAKACSPIIG